MEYKKLKDTILGGGTDLKSVADKKIPKRNTDGIKKSSRTLY